MTDDLVPRIVAFLHGIGISASAARLDLATFLPGIAIRSGSLLYDPDRLTYPTDLLHEAGHIAVTAGEERQALDTVDDDPAGEMAAIAWSYAAAVALEIDARTLFHDGYKGGGAALAAAFTQGGGMGVPMLAWWGMTVDPVRARRTGEAPFPSMTRWLR